MTREEVKGVLAICFDTYPTKKISNPEHTIEIWYEVLGGYDLDTVLKAVKLYISESAFFPTPADIKNRLFRANLIYGNAPQTPKIEASKDSYIEEQIEYLMREFCEGGSLGYD